MGLGASSVPHNGSAHNLRDPLKGFRPGYQTSSPGHTSRRHPRPEGHIERRRRNPKPARQKTVWFRGLLCGVQVRSGHMVYRSPGTSFTHEGCLGCERPQRDSGEPSTEITRVASGL
jgi:hypothetical protein